METKYYESDKAEDEFNGPNIQVKNLAMQSIESMNKMPATGPVTKQPYTGNAKRQSRSRRQSAAVEADIDEIIE